VSAAPEDRWTWLDLRLVPVAATVWGVTLAGGVLPPPVLAGVAGAAVLAAAAPVRHRHRAGALVLLAVLAALATTAGVAAVRGAARAGSPLLEVTSARTVEVVVEVDGDPRRIRGAGSTRVVLDATVTGFDDGTRTVDLTAGVVLFASAEDWGGVVPGQTVRTRAAVTAVPASEGVVARLSARGPPELLGRSPWVQRAADGLRDGLAASSARVVGGPAGALLPGLVVGDTRAVDPVLEEDFRRAGLSHLTAVSGVNVG
jgi:competence protein ComEC